MSVPELVRERLGDEEVRAQVPLDKEDTLVMTSTRTLAYRGEGLLSGESVSEYPHDAERVAVSEGRRNSTILLDHGLEGESELSVPTDSLDDALLPLLGGVLRTAGVTDDGERIRDIHRLGELTVVITDGRVIKYIGSAVWAEDDFEEYDFERVTGLGVEQGTVSSQIIVEVDHRPQRIKTPSEDTRAIREQIERGLLEYHGVETLAEFERLVRDRADGEDSSADGSDGEPAEHDPEPASATEEAAEAHADDGAKEPPGEGEMVFAEEEPLDVEETAAESTGAPVDVAEEVAALRAAVERQNELLESHQRTIEQLIEELRRER